MRRSSSSSSSSPPPPSSDENQWQSPAQSPLNRRRQRRSGSGGPKAQPPSLDLHGFTKEPALRRLVDFLDQHQSSSNSAVVAAASVDIVHVITGVGRHSNGSNGAAAAGASATTAGPVLKPAVESFLQRHGFCYQCDGGRFAVAVHTGTLHRQASASATSTKLAIVPSSSKQQQQQQRNRASRVPPPPLPLHPPLDSQLQQQPLPVVEGDNPTVAEVAADDAQVSHAKAASLREQQREKAAAAADRRALSQALLLSLQEQQQQHEASCSTDPSETNDEGDETVGPQSQETPREHAATAANADHDAEERRQLELALLESAQLEESERQEDEMLQQALALSVAEPEAAAAAALPVAPTPPVISAPNLSAVDNSVLAFLEQQQQLQQQVQLYDDCAYEVMMQRALEESAALEALEHEQEELMLRQALALSAAESAAAHTVPLGDLWPRNHADLEPPPLEDFSHISHAETSATVPPHHQDSSDESDVDDLPGLIPSHTLLRRVIRRQAATTTATTTSDDDSDDDVPPLMPIPGTQASRRRAHSPADVPPIMPIPGTQASRQRHGTTIHNDSDDDLPPLLPPEPSSSHSPPPSQPPSRAQRAGQGKAFKKNGSNGHHQHHHHHHRVVTNSSSDFANGLVESPATADITTTVAVYDGDYGVAMDDEEALNEVPFLQFLYRVDDTMVVWNDYYSFARRLGGSGTSGTTSGGTATGTGMSPVNPDQRLLLRLLSQGSNGDDDRRSRRR
jgi:Smr domain